MSSPSQNSPRKCRVVRPEKLASASNTGRRPRSWSRRHQAQESRSERCPSNRQNPQGRGCRDPVRLPGEPADRGGGRGRHPDRDRAPGAGRAPHGGRLQPAQLRRQARRVLHAARPGGGERLRRRGPGLRRVGTDHGHPHGLPDTADERGSQFQLVAPDEGRGQADRPHRRRQDGERDHAPGVLGVAKRSAATGRDRGGGRHLLRRRQGPDR